MPMNASSMWVTQYGFPYPQSASWIHDRKEDGLFELSKTL